MSSKARSCNGYCDFVRGVARGLSERGIAQGGYAVVKSLPSTHVLGRRVAREYSQEETMPPCVNLLAWQQTAGEGRGGRSWASPPGGVYATLVRTLAAEAQVQILPLLVATALCDALNADLGDRCRLKWPNDLLVDGRKLGGVLIDAASRGGGALAVISFGVNHGPLEQPGATSLEREAPGRTLLVADLAVRLFEAVDAALEGDRGSAEVVDRYRRLSLHRPGDALRCRLGGDEVEGVFQGFDGRGFLRLSVGGEERRVAAGEIANDG